MRITVESADGWLLPGPSHRVPRAAHMSLPGFVQCLFPWVRHKVPSTFISGVCLKKPCWYYHEQGSNEIVLREQTVFLRQYSWGTHLAVELTRTIQPPGRNKMVTPLIRELKTHFLAWLTLWENWIGIRCSHPWWPQTNVMALHSVDSLLHALGFTENGLVFPLSSKLFQPSTNLFDCY